MLTHRLKVTLLDMNLLPDDGFIKKKPKNVGVLISWWFIF